MGTYTCRLVAFGEPYCTTVLLLHVQTMPRRTKYAIALRPLNAVFQTGTIERVRDVNAHGKMPAGEICKSR